MPLKNKSPSIVYHLVPPYKFACASFHSLLNG
jgi:hypothetical protein